MNSFEGTGFVGTRPELRTVAVNGEDRQVCHFRFYIDRRVPDGKGGYVDQGGLWFRVTVWGRMAEHVTRVIDKGMLVHVRGTVYLHCWMNKDTGEERSELRIDASRGSDAVTLVLMFVDQVQATQRPGKPAELDAANTGTDLEGQADEEPVPFEPVPIDGEGGDLQESVLAQSAGPTVTDGGTKKGGRRRAR